MTGLAFLITAATSIATAATPAQGPTPIVRASWDGTPAGFEVRFFQSDWIWVESAAYDLDATAAVKSSAVIHLPVDWEYKATRNRTAKVTEVRKEPGYHPGDWIVKAEQNVILGAAEIEFLDDRGNVHPLTLTLKTQNLKPYVIVRAKCPKYDVELHPRASAARFLFLIVSCFEHGADAAILAITRSPDAKWIASPAIKDPKAPRFEYNFPNTPDTKLFTLYTEDAEGRRAEWAVSTSHAR